MKIIKKFFICNNKGVSMTEIVIVLATAFVLVVGFTGSWGDKDRLTDGWRIESQMIMKDIIEKEKIYAAAHMNKYTRDIAQTGKSPDDIDSFNVDLRTKSYFKEFSVEVRTEQAPDATGTNRNIDILYVTLYGSGSASGVTRKAKYNRFANTIEWTDGRYTAPTP
ncbi:MAG: hypothetical protein LBR69_00855 [Endomicrobium sp.]|jgi:hypothetical protein|nr:hypothetical protein [Endomicrobium sp.]